MFSYANSAFFISWVCSFYFALLLICLLLGSYLITIPYFHSSFRHSFNPSKLFVKKRILLISVLAVVLLSCWLSYNSYFRHVLNEYQLSRLQQEMMENFEVNKEAFRDFSRMASGYHSTGTSLLEQPIMKRTDKMPVMHASRLHFIRQLNEFKNVIIL